MRAEKVGKDTLLARIVEMVARAQRSRAPIQRLADQVAAWFVPAVIAVALAAFAAWSLFGPEPRFTYALVAAVTVLIIACPCALGLATPMSIMVAVGRGARSGILIRDADALQRLETIDTLVIDKTGTLTEGKPKVVGIHAAFGFDEAETLRLAASVERASEHPLGAAIVAAARERNLGLGEVRDFESPTGRGARGLVDGRDVVIGNAAYLGERGIDAGSLKPAAQARREHGATVIFVGVDKRAAGLIAIADPIRPTTAEALRALSADGIRLVMLTGDNATTARAVARQLGIDEVEAEALPEQKSAFVERLRASGRKVAMAGDGVNDAPCARCGRRRHRHGRRHRCSDRERRRDAAAGRSAGNRRGAQFVACDNAQHPPEPRLRFRLQRGRRADCRGRAVSGVWHSIVADDRRCSDGAVVGQRDRQCAAARTLKVLVFGTGQVAILE